MKSNSIRHFLLIASFISLWISILLHLEPLLYRLGIHGPFGLREEAGEKGTMFFAEIIITFVVALLLFVLNYFFIKPDNPHKVLKSRVFLISVLLSLITSIVLTDIFFTINHLIHGSFNPFRFSFYYFLNDIFIVSVVISCTLLIRNFYQKQKALLINLELEKENLQSRYSLLKTQLSPHFLFNTLSALKTLVSDNPEKARKYIDHLAIVLRSTLQFKEIQTVFLQDEMKVVESYLFLLRTRFGSNLTLEISVHEKYMNYQLPPFALQVLIENVVKHNEISKKNPLTIAIYTTENNSLAVKNPVQRKLSTETGAGVGLENLSGQLRLIGAGELSISEINDEFIVEIPLIDQNKNEGINH